MPPATAGHLPLDQSPQGRLCQGCHGPRYPPPATAHRGTKEADLLIGGFFDAHAQRWDKSELDWFEALLEEQDVDIMAWAIGVRPSPADWDGEMMQAMRRLGYVPLPN